MISVIVISLNTKDDFIKTINSIVTQTKKVEIIVVDGYSKDGTIEEIKKFSKYLNKIIIEKDEGIYFAMNKGIRMASNEWLYFLNSGDIFFDNTTLENIMNILIQNKKADVVIGNSLVKKKNYLVKSPRTKMNNNTVNSCFSHQSTFVKKDLLKQYSFDTKFKYASDFDFFLKLFKLNKKFLYIDQFISINKYGGISDINRIKVYLEFRNIIFNLNNNFFNLFKINSLIFINFLKKIFKLVLPNSLIEKIVFYLDKKNKS
jgi:glycosyltransferase involved in cell wall biosynthesis